MVVCVCMGYGNTPHKHVSIVRSEVVLHLVSVEQVHDQGVQLVLGQLGLLQDLLQAAKVLLQLLLDILVHAGLHLLVLEALHVGLHLGHVDEAGIVVLLHVVGGQVLGHLDALLNVVLDTVLQPLVLDGKLVHVVLLHALVQLVLLVEDAHLAQDTGHVANLLLHPLLLGLQLVGQPVSDVQGHGQGHSRVLVVVVVVGLSLVAAQELSHAGPVAVGLAVVHLVHVLHLVPHHILHEGGLVKVGVATVLVAVCVESRNTIHFNIFLVPFVT